MDDSPEELRRRGLELQAALPEPKGWGPRFVRERKEPSDTGEVVEGVIEGLVTAGFWGLLLTVPAVVIHVLRRRWRPRPSTGTKDR